MAFAGMSFEKSNNIVSILHHLFFNIIRIPKHLLWVNLGIVERDAVDGSEYFFCQFCFSPWNKIHRSYGLSGIFRLMGSLSRNKFLVVMGIYVIVIALRPLETPSFDVLSFENGCDSVQIWLLVKIITLSAGQGKSLVVS